MSSLLQDVLTSQMAASGLKESEGDLDSSSAEPELEHKNAAPKIRAPRHADNESGASDDELVGKSMICHV